MRSGIHFRALLLIGTFALAPSPGYADSLSQRVVNATQKTIRHTKNAVRYGRRVFVGRREVPAGKTLCDVLYLQAAGGNSNLQIPDAPSLMMPAWTTNNHSATTLEHDLNRALSVQRSITGGSETKFVEGFFSDKRQYVPEDFEIEPAPRFRPTSASEDLLLHEAFQNIKAEEINNRRMKEKQPSQATLENSKIIEALDRIQARKLISDEDVAALEILRNRVKEFAGTANFLQSKASVEGRVDTAVSDYLTRHKDEIRARIKTLQPEESLKLALPTMAKDDNGKPKLSAQVLEFRDVKEFDFVMRAKLSAAKEVSTLRRLRKQYQEDYMFSRAFAARLEAIQRAKSEVFSLDAHISDEENARISKYNKFNAEIQEALASDKPIHPDLKRVVRVSRNSHLKHYAITAGVIIISGVVIYLTGADYYDKLKAKAYDPAVVLLDKSKIFDEDYWIEKCKDEESIAQTDDCLFMYEQYLSAELDRQTNLKKESNPHYTDLAEKKRFDDVFIRVADAIYTSLPMKLYTRSTAEEAIGYAKKKGFQSASKHLAAKVEQSATATTESVANSSTENLDTLKEIEDRYQAISREFDEFQSKHHLAMKQLENDPDATAEMQINQVLYMNNITTRLRYLIQITPAKANATEQALLHQSINDRIDQIESEVLTFKGALVARIVDKKSPNEAPPRAPIAKDANEK